MRLKRIIVTALISLAFVPFLYSQTVTDDEIKFGSQPYFPQDPNAIRVKSDLVEVSVVVRDSHGQPISGLTKNDFEIYDQGKQQPISLFTAELANPSVTPPHSETVNDAIVNTPSSTAPAQARYLGLYFDDQNISSANMIYSRKAAAAFIQNNMEEADRAGIFTSSASVTQEFTSDKKKLLDAIAKLLSHQRGGLAACPNMTPYQAYQIDRFRGQVNDAYSVAMADAIRCNCTGLPPTIMRDCQSQQSSAVQSQATMVLSQSEQFAQDSLGALGDVIRHLENMSGRKTLIMVSSGFFSQSEKIQRYTDMMIDGAIHAGVVINTLDATGVYTTSDSADASRSSANSSAGAALGVNGGALQARSDAVRLDENVVSGESMAALAYGTGGKFFHNSNDMTGGLRDMAALPSASYVLGFSPRELKDNGAYHDLKVKLPGQHGVSISARPGYFAPTQQETAPVAKLEALKSEVMSSDTLTGIVPGVTTQSGSLHTGESVLEVTIHVPPRGLSFKTEEKRHTERLIFITAIFDSQNHYVEGTQAVIDMKLKDNTFRLISQNGVDAKATLQLRPGTYRVREVVQAFVNGRIGTISRNVEIR